MFDIIPLILILISLSTIIIVVVRKFSVLSKLDVDNFQSEKEAKFKEQIIGKKLKRNFYKYSSRVTRLFKPASQSAKDFSIGIYKKLEHFKDNYNKEKEVKVESEETVVEKNFREAEEFFKEEKFAEAEGIYIEIIGMESTNIKAFQKLGMVYMSKKAYNEAKQTLSHVIKLLEVEYDPNSVISGDGGSEVNAQLASAYFSLTLANIELEDQDSAIVSIEQALSVEPNNPRYLDTKFEISIIRKDSEKAKEAYQKMKEVDPDNQKLDELKKQVEELEISDKELLE